MAYDIKQRDDGKWEWWQLSTAYGMVQGVSDTYEDAVRDLKVAWYDLIAE